MALRDTEGYTFSPSFRLLEEVPGINIIVLFCAEKIQLQLFSLSEYRDWRGASAASCLGLIGMKPPEQAGCFGQVATNAAPWGGGRA